jgi:hypothetical protein
MANSTQKRRQDLVILQAEHSEYLYRRENEIQDKIEQEQSLTPEEWHLFWMRKTQHLQDFVEGFTHHREGD